MYSKKEVAAIKRGIFAAHHHFHMLGVNRTSTPAQITEARNALLRAVHPDRDPSTEVLEAGRLAATVNQAADILCDKKRVKLYLAELAHGRSRCPTCKGDGAVRQQKSMKDVTYVTCRACNGAGLL